MAKILFISNVWYESLALMQLSAVVKKAGHDSEIYMISGKALSRKLLSFIEAYSPDVVGFSIVAGQHFWALSAATFIKSSLKNSPLIVFGGPYPTFVPEIINEGPVDIICRGEGEGALADLMNTLSAKGDITKIPNLWVRREGTITKNEVRPLTDDLDSLPFPDQKLYNRYGYFRNNPVKMVLASRGCPFNCSFCFNDKYRELYKDHGSLVRRRSPQNLINEIRPLKNSYKNVRYIKFIDDIFTLDTGWLYDFLEIYKQEIGLQFVCNIRPDVINEETVKKLAESGCRCVMFGIETGNEYLRNDILNKQLTDRQIFYATSLLKKYKIKFYVSNILFIPGTNIKNAWETVSMNQKINPDFLFVGVFQPYPGTSLYEKLRRQGILPEDYLATVKNFESFPLLKPEPLLEEKNVYFLFYLLVHFPWLTPVIKLFIRNRLNSLSELIFRASAGIDYSRLYKLSPQRFFRMAYYNLIA